MKILLKSLLLLMAVSIVHAQDVPDLIPPSPEAASMLTYGNTGVSFYTGQPNVSIPIHTISVRGYQFPISLSYSSFQGINVESVAPWVGLGWSLNATGTVSRTIRGKADETFSEGYIRIPEPDITDPLEMEDYGDGDYDGEPDKFYYSMNGISGTFFFNKTDTTALRVVQKPIENVDIDWTLNDPITQFELTDANGYVYTFSEQEKTQSVGMGQATTGVANPVTSWYLSTIKDQKGNTLLTFTYYTLSNLEYTTFAPNSQKENLAAFTSSDMSHTTHYLTAKRIKEITYPGGKVKFNISTGTRQDYKNDKYLTEIEIYDGNNALIKEFRFDYDYFDENGITDISATPTGVSYKGSNVGDYKKRLKLNSIQEYNNNSTQSLPPYSFTYNYESGNYLPHRYTFAQDHWGYSNGKTSNTSPEPYYRFKYYILGNTEKFAELGSADRAADVTKTKAGVLKRITYPTGGYTEFEMEGNVAVNDELPHAVQDNGPTNIKADDSAHSFDVELISEPFVVLDISGTTAQSCNITGGIYRQSDNSQVGGSGFTINAVSIGGGTYQYDYKFYLTESGSFYIKLKYQSGCSYVNPTDGLYLSYKDEVALTNKPVGGLRVKKITDHDGISSANDVVRNFYYNENGETGNSTGRVGNVPQYAYQRVVETYLPSSDSWQIVPEGITRTITPHYPLMSTNGSFVGYKKVTVITSDGQGLGKTEYEFTTAEDYPDVTFGYYNNLGDAYFSLGNFGVHDLFPFPPTEDRDYMRGKLVKQRDYRWNGSAYEIVKSLENTYSITFDMPQENGETGVINPWNSFKANNSNHIYSKGLKVKTYRNGSGTVTSIKLKRYNVYSGRFDLSKSITRNYDLNSPANYIETQTESFWDDLNDTDQYVNVSRTKFTDSEGNIRETKYYYPFDNVTEVSSSVRTGMVGKNIVGALLKQEEFIGTTKLSTLVTKYAGFNANAHYFPMEVQMAKGTASLEARVNYNDYDAYGNPVEVQQTNGTKIVYLWGYDHTLPVAKIENATKSDVVSVITQSVLDNPASDAALMTELDKLRSDPDLKNALITTMTYLPGVGVTSQKSPNGIIVYYEYDSFGRLEYIKDQDGNILKKNEYVYQVNANTTNN
ncbi:hypothetical protein [Roseivirga sp.]|uniref:hypothetical protein n=1 Tax=Roseivirga sp. TaxID=1964215 RepID=UPI003B5169B3